MRINYIGSQNIRFVVAVWMLLCWVFGASAAEKWDAKTTARVNLRRNPSSNGVILSIVPKGYRVRIMEKQGLWSKIDVEGDIHGKGWVYAEYLEEILSKVPEAKTNLQTPLAEKASRVDVMQPPSMHEEIPPGRDKTGALSRVKIPTAGEPPHTAPAQASREIRTENEKEIPLTATKSEKVPMPGSKQHPSTQNELQDMQPKSNAVSPMEKPVMGNAIHVAPVQPQQSGINSHPPGVIKKAFSEIPIQSESNSRHTDFPDETKEPATTGQRKPLEVKERSVSNALAVGEAPKQRLAVSNKRKGPTANQKSMGLVELALKLTSIALTGLVILVLHRSNKIAASHYKALMQIQNRLNSQP